jgi:hypothetical protein
MVPGKMTKWKSGFSTLWVKMGSSLGLFFITLLPCPITLLYPLPYIPYPYRHNMFIPNICEFIGEVFIAFYHTYLYIR